MKTSFKPEHSILWDLVVGQWFLELVDLQQKVLSDLCHCFHLGGQTHQSITSSQGPILPKLKLF